MESSTSHRRRITLDSTHIERYTTLPYDPSISLPETIHNALITLISDPTLEAVSFTLDVSLEKEVPEAIADMVDSKDHIFIARNRADYLDSIVVTDSTGVIVPHTIILINTCGITPPITIEYGVKLITAIPIRWMNWSEVIIVVSSEYENPTVRVTYFIEHDDASRDDKHKICVLSDDTCFYGCLDIRRLRLPGSLTKCARVKSILYTSRYRVIFRYMSTYTYKKYQESGSIHQKRSTPSTVKLSGLMSSASKFSVIVRSSLDMAGCVLNSFLVTSRPA